MMRLLAVAQLLVMNTGAARDVLRRTNAAQWAQTIVVLVVIAVEVLQDGVFVVCVILACCGLVDLG